jgi:hypothetical protein
MKSPSTPKGERYRRILGVMKCCYNLESISPSYKRTRWSVGWCTFFSNQQRGADDDTTHAKALQCFRRLFSIRPYDIQALKQCVFVYSSGSTEVDIWEGIQYLVKAFEHHIKLFVTPYDDHRGDVSNEMDREYIQLVVDLLLMARDYEVAATVLKRGERWLQSRSKQTFWDKLEDDSEYDPPGVSRAEDDIVTEDREGYNLDVAMRARLAVIRIKLAQDVDANVCPSCLMVQRRPVTKSRKPTIRPGIVIDPRQNDQRERSSRIRSVLDRCCQGVNGKS